MKTTQTSNAPDVNDAIVKLFNDFDVKETSHHLVISHLDLHICDDIHAKEKGKIICLFQTILVFLELATKLNCLLNLLCRISCKIICHNCVHMNI